MVRWICTVLWFLVLLLVAWEFATAKPKAPANPPQTIWIFIANPPLRPVAYTSLEVPRG